VTLTTARLLLRAFRADDEDALFRLWNDSEVGRYLWDAEPVSRETTRAQIEASRRSFEQRRFGLFTLALRERPDALVGFAGLRGFGEREQVELLYALLPRYWGRGLATEASAAVLRLGFEARLLEIWAGADPSNLASFRVMERLGMAHARDLAPGGRPVRYYRLGRPSA
jgi:ribosomal-protein-alanine N-acetyltransferase